jgi:hypothetical protein
MASSHSTRLQLPDLPNAAGVAHIFPSLNTASLISIGKLCDHNCTAVFTKTRVEVRNADNNVVIQGQRAPNGLWHLNLKDCNARTAQEQPHHSANLSTLAHQSASDRIAFLHAAAGYPVLSTWLKAIEAGYFATWPGLTATTVRRYLPASIISAKGHLDQQRANTRSTQPKSTALASSQPTNTTTTETARTHAIFVDCQPISGQVFSDLPGKFLVTSSRGMNYILLVYDYDSNAIITEPIKSRSGHDITQGYKKIHTLLVSRGLQPKL